MKKNLEKCPIDHSIEVLSGKWTLPILHALAERQPMRFNELEKELESITPAMLSTRLRQFEARHIVTRKVYATVPPMVEYSLTEIGIAMKPMIMELEKWGLLHLEKSRFSASDVTNNL